MTSDRAKARRQRVQVIVALIIVALVPGIYAGLLTWANDDTTGRLNQVPALIVNADRPATLDDGTTVALGDTLAKELVSSTRKNNFSWTVAEADDATTQLAAGQVFAVLWVPENFSSGVASLQGDPNSAARAMLTIETDDAVNTIAGNMASSIGDAITDSLAESISQEYLQKIYVGFTSTHDAVARAADGAARLHDGTQSATAGSYQLVVGLGDLASGATDLANGTATLAAGAQSVSKGAADLNGGLNQLNAGGAALAQGAASVASGAGQLQSGVDQLANRASTLSDAVGAMSGGADAALAHASTLRDGLGHLSVDGAALASGAATMNGALAELENNWDSLSDAERRSVIRGLTAQSATVADGAAAVERGTATLASASTSLVGTSDEAGLRALAHGASQLAGHGQNVRSAITTFTTGVNDLASGSAQLSSGVSTYVTAVDRLAQGSATLAGGSQAIANGSTQLQTGANTLADGSHTAAAGATSLASGLSELESGAGELATGLADGRDAIPSYTDAEATHLAHTAAVPVEHNATRANEVPTSAYAMGPYFMALALWIGGIALYLLTDPLRGKRLGTWLGGLSSFAPGAAMAVFQAVALVGTLGWLLGVRAANVPGLIALAVLASLTFVAINQALAGLLGTPGRFLALVLIVVQLAAAGGTYPVQTSPSFFGAVHNWLPLTHVVRGFRSLTAGGSVDLTGGILVILAWLLAALAVTTYAAKRNQQPACGVGSPRSESGDE